MSKKEKGKRNDKTKWQRKKSTTVRRRRKKVIMTSNNLKDTIENGAKTSVGTEEEAKTKKTKKKKRRRLWTKRVRKKERSLSPDSELFEKTFGFHFGIFRSPTKRRSKRQPTQPSPPPSPSVQRSTRRRKEKEHSKKSIADGATACQPLDTVTETGGFNEHDKFEPNKQRDRL
ncbi:BZ3500_MvSof-1268-A1-R1_Chr10-1g02598 [Microbotryum saponariae]|uniref:BZ3500_MvSof-1268-A1-R1_Chr10-1g02598 protein n=1 Tax=Microbotryum saponariae TaxID=289078 RepID=A0A2X0NKN8_9BASI|nr:BZ3500_MvSof-1268-A1-R1_Chr10-1g02598 [Microbotryum saponariae]SDA06087.1 BZ3501_MvSof-1269-A2-R1_Chr10-1g02199 [Microbotryum saponariae]